MNYLFIHQTVPGQYLHLIRHLALDPANRVYCIGQRVGVPIPGVETLLYAVDGALSPAAAGVGVEMDRAIRVGAAVADACRQLRDQHRFEPAIVIGHSGWGETLFVKDVFPEAPLLSYFEFYYHRHGADIGFDPEYASDFADPARLRVRNGVILMSADAADWGNTPTQWQCSLFPPELRQRITVLHEGVDTDALKPDPSACFDWPALGLQLKAEDEVVTYAARNLEPYRGFHSFMRAVPHIMRRRPGAHVVIVGGDEVSYGTPAAPGMTYREQLLAEIHGQYDPRRLHMLPAIDHTRFRQLLQISSAHVYLTYPFILSWSFIEAMAAGCAIVGSSTPPVMEVMDDEVSGLAVDFFDAEQIADRVVTLLSDQALARRLRRAARQTAVRRYDLKRKILPRWIKLLQDLQRGHRPATGH